MKSAEMSQHHVVFQTLLILLVPCRQHALTSQTAPIRVTDILANYTVSQKSSLCSFLLLLGQMLTIIIICSNTVAEEICNQITYTLLTISILFMNIT